ncbi:MAG: metal ABC transporter ATP-binding protein [Deltaproteobacteria bacterium]|nr:metal ABC transporter ATP-binding protein [Deltaproteobacteria bacterium]
MSNIIIKLDKVGIGYAGREVLSGISVSICRFSFTAILGANGSGKTTLLKTILGLLPPVAGRMEAAPSGERLIFGYVPQASRLDPVYLLTGFEVALMGVYGRVRPGRFVPQAERALTRQCLQATGAEEFSHRRFSELSGGQKQRVLIARALATHPDILLLDEPTAGVDHAATQAVMEFISQLHKESKITVLLVTHDLAAAHRYAEQVIWLDDGKVFQGPVDKLLTAEHFNEILTGTMD